MKKEAEEKRFKGWVGKDISNLDSLLGWTKDNDPELEFKGTMFKAKGRKLRKDWVPPVGEWSEREWPPRRVEVIVRYLD